MTDRNNEPTVAEEAPEAEIEAKRSFSIVWLVPLVALLIGGWLAYKAYSEKGPTITISFNTAEGLEAGKTKLKYKDVEVGEVEAITLSKDLSHVVVTAKLVKESDDYLTENTRFWVVRARIAAGSVTGLGTLFSGAYIGMDPIKGEKSTRTFKGLEIPPVVTADLPGRHFLLQGDRLGSLDIGTPVFFRQIQVGEVVSYHLDDDGEAVSIKVFIHAPHDKRVRENTRFWNDGGFDMSVDATGIKIDTETFVSMIIGGVAFDTPTDLESGNPVEGGHTFRLYKNRRSIYTKQYTLKHYYMLHFNGSVKGLSSGAPVEFRGIKIGEVVDIKLEFHEKELEPRIPVLIQIEPERIAFIGEQNVDPEKRMEGLVVKGLRAQLKTGNLLTGQLLVDVDLHPEAPAQEIDYAGKYPELPTLPTPLEQITTRLAQIVNKLEKVPFELIGNDLHETLQETQKLVKNLNADVAPMVSGALEQAQKTLASVENVMSSDSVLQHELNRALAELANAARSISNLADYLERHPESLIYGKGKE
jgi:paraquat-inducible protein B